MEKEIAALYDRLLRQAKFYYPRSTDDAYDLVNDTMLKMLTNQDKFQEGTNLFGWACMIMRNLFINDYSKELDIREAINDLPENERVCINYLICGYSYERMAEIFEVPIGTVKSRIHIARKKLQKVLTRY